MFWNNLPFARLVWQVAALNCGFPFVFTVRYRPVHTVAHPDKNKYTKRLLCTWTRCIAAIVIGRFTQWLLIYIAIMSWLNVLHMWPHRGHHRLLIKTSRILGASSSQHVINLTHTDTHACKQWSNSWSVSHERHWWLLGFKSQRADVSCCSSWKINRAVIHADAV